MSRGASILVGLCVLGAPDAMARKNPPKPAETVPAPEAAAIEEAKRHFLQGIALYNEKNFNAALAEFEAANQAHHATVVLYNIGLCQKGLFRYAESIETLHRYLTEATAAKSLAPDRKAEVEQMVTEMSALLVDVALVVAPDGASLVLDGRSTGTTPVGTLTLAAGHHVIELSADGYKPARKELDLSAGMPLGHVLITLEAIPKTGKLHLAVATRDSTVRIDGRLLGVPPLDVELGLGGHAVEIAAPGFLTNRQEIVVAAGQTRTLEIELERPKKFRPWEKWWFWTLGVVVVGGIAAAIAIPLSISTQSPLPGTLGAGRVN